MCECVSVKMFGVSVKMFGVSVIMFGVSVKMFGVSVRVWECTFDCVCVSVCAFVND